jgi:tripartite ATP-independent transporter DctP family solute receptor
MVRKLVVAGKGAAVGALPIGAPQFRKVHFTKEGKMKKFVQTAMAVACAALLASGVAQAQVRDQTFRWTTQNPADHPISQGGQKFAELVAQKSGGKMQVKLFPGGVLGGDVQVLSAVQGGTIDMTSMNSGILQGQVKEFAIVDFPFLFNDAKEADAIMDGPIGKALSDKLPEKGLVNLAYFDLGFRNVTNSKRLIKTADDIAGLKIRVIQSPIYIDTFNALGANSVPMAFTEVYTGLEQKAIDGQENPYTVIEANKFQEVQKYLAGTRHMYNPQSMFISKKTWDRLNKDEQKVLLDAAKESAVFQRKFSRDAQDASLANLKKTMEYTELPPAEVAKIRTKLKPVIDKYSANVGLDFAKQVYSEVDKVRGK